MSGHRKWRAVKADKEANRDWQRMTRIVRRFSTSDLLEHMDAAGSGMARAVQAFRRDNDDDTPLLEIGRALLELTAVNDELKLRFEAAHDEN